eukprot:CAMPEP_0202698406 /NCGR_PEP_ID=MMETSP1385-20130828/11696_1 /ASSEMBLY_ACC=CAM_ASM_000861 /TAXON_ID=933848 /ORGANISM="Elphidium margaritaceum" /LENGTH=669 /DNA_ID=CAMNT_0049355121 /DNA_START=75 /DNA_END=2084 /DNA_ORIENTATION=-
MKSQTSDQDESLFDANSHDHNDTDMMDANSTSRSYSSFINHIHNDELSQLPISNVHNATATHQHSKNSEHQHINIEYSKQRMVKSKSISLQSPNMNVQLKDRQQHRTNHAHGANHGQLQIQMQTSSHSDQHRSEHKNSQNPYLKFSLLQVDSLNSPNSATNASSSSSLTPTVDRISSNKSQPNLMKQKQMVPLPSTQMTKSSSLGGAKPTTATQSTRWRHTSTTTATANNNNNTMSTHNVRNKMTHSLLPNLGASGQRLDADDEDEDDEKMATLTLYTLPSPPPSSSSQPTRRKRARTWAQQKSKYHDLMHRFLQTRFGDNNGKRAHIDKLKLTKYAKLTHDELLKRCRVVYDRANSLLNGHNCATRQQSIAKFEECLDIIYILYTVSPFLSDAQKSAIITQHMNICLNLGELYVGIGLREKFGFALRMYEEAQTLFEFDPTAFKSKINLKSFILSKMADVYIKQEEFSSALGLLEEALNDALDSNDKDTQCQILVTQGRALLDAKQFEKASIVFEKAIALSIELNTLHSKANDSYDFDLYRNAALCYAKMAHSFCSVVYISSTKTYAVKNTAKSMQYWVKSAKLYKESVAVCKALYGTHTIQYIECLYEWSDVLCTKGDYNQSYHLYQNIQTLFKQIDVSLQTEHEAIINKTQQMINTLRPYVNNNTL